MSRYERLREEATRQAGVAMWGERTEAVHLGAVAMAAVGPMYEGVLEARDEEIEYLKARNLELLRRLDDIRRMAAV